MTQKTYPTKLVSNVRALLGEGPVWDDQDQHLWWCDINSRKIYRTDVDSGISESFDLGTKVGCFALTESGKIAAARENDVALLDPATGEITPMFELESDMPESRFNDGKCDVLGRLWFGSMHRKGQGSFYLYNPADGSVTTKETDISTSNGLGWSPDNSVMYYTDTPKGEIWVYDFDLESGNISNRRTLIDLRQRPAGKPDGLTVDVDGNIWSAQWDGSCVLKISPQGELLEEVSVPVLRPTSCAFGGKNRDRLFVTSAGQNLDPLSSGPDCFDHGKLIELDVGVQGLPFHRLKGH